MSKYKDSWFLDKLYSKPLAKVTKKHQSATIEMSFNDFISTANDAFKKGNFALAAAYYDAALSEIPYSLGLKEITPRIKRPIGYEAYNDLSKEEKADLYYKMALSFSLGSSHPPIKVIKDISNTIISALSIAAEFDNSKGQITSENAHSYFQKGNFDIALTNYLCCRWAIKFSYKSDFNFQAQNLRQISLAFKENISEIYINLKGEIKSSSYLSELETIVYENELTEGILGMNIESE